MPTLPYSEPPQELTEDTGARSLGAVSTGAASAGAVSLGALALGSFAVGAVAMGALAIGAVAIGRLSIVKSHIKSLEIDELTVRRLTLESGTETRTVPLDYKAAAKELLTRFSQFDDRIEHTQAEAARLREETRVMLTEIEALVSTSKATANRTEEAPEQEYKI